MLLFLLYSFLTFLSNEWLINQGVQLSFSITSNEISKRIRDRGFDICISSSRALVFAFNTVRLVIFKVITLVILNVVAIVIVFKVVFKDCDSNFETDIFSIIKV